MRLLITNKKDDQEHIKEFDTYTDCRHWMINHLDQSKEWQVQDITSASKIKGIGEPEPTKKENCGSCKHAKYRRNQAVCTNTNTTMALTVNTLFDTCKLFELRKTQGKFTVGDTVNIPQNKVESAYFGEGEIVDILEDFGIAVQLPDGCVWMQPEILEFVNNHKYNL